MTPTFPLLKMRLKEPGNSGAPICYNNLGSNEPMQVHANSRITSRRTRQARLDGPKKCDVPKQIVAGED